MPVSTTATTTPGEPVVESHAPGTCIFVSAHSLEYEGSFGVDVAWYCRFGSANCTRALFWRPVMVPAVLRLEPGRTTRTPSAGTSPTFVAPSEASRAATARGGASAR